jgi:hypothetical protein
VRCRAADGTPEVGATMVYNSATVTRRTNRGRGLPGEPCEWRHGERGTMRP